MKHLFLTLSVAALMGAMAAGATDFESGDLAYTVTDATTHTVKVKGLATGSTATQITIPATVTDNDNGVTYTVTAIGSKAFKGNTTITTIVPNDNIISYGDSCFYGASNLSSVTPWPANLRTLGNRSFLGTAITSLVLPESVTYIADYCFQNCNKLTSVTVGNSVTTLRTGVFMGCNTLNTMVLGTGITSLNYSFCLVGCPLTSLTLNSPVVVSISTAAYDWSYETHNLKPATCVVKVPNNMLADYRTSTNQVLQKFTNIIPATPVTVGDLKYQATAKESAQVIGLADNAGTGLDIIPANTVTIGGYDFVVNSVAPEAFVQSTKIKSFTFPAAATYASNRVFMASTVEEITTSPAMTGIGQYAFYGCTNLKKITLDARINSIGYRCMGYCSSLKTVDMKNPTPPSLLYNLVFDSTPVSSATLIVPAAAVDAYKEATGWKDFGTIISDVAAGINDVEAAGNDGARYYDLTGREVSSPAHGIYVKVTGGKSQKVAL